MGCLFGMVFGVFVVFGVGVGAHTMHISHNTPITLNRRRWITGHGSTAASFCGVVLVFVCYFGVGVLVWVLVWCVVCA